MARECGGDYKKSMQMVCSAVARYEKKGKSAANSSFASKREWKVRVCREIGEAVKQLDARNSFTAVMASAEAATNDSTYENKHQLCILSASQKFIPLP